MLVAEAADESRRRGKSRLIHSRAAHVKRSTSGLFQNEWTLNLPATCELAAAEPTSDSKSFDGVERSGAGRHCCFQFWPFIF